MGRCRDAIGAMRRLEPPPRRVHGKYVENLLPPGSPDKGDALAAVMRHLEGLALGLRHRGECLLEDGLEEVTECSVRQARLGLDRTA